MFIYMKLMTAVFSGCVWLLARVAHVGGGWVISDSAAVGFGLV